MENIKDDSYFVEKILSELEIIFHATVNMEIVYQIVKISVPEFVRQLKDI